MEDAGKMDNSEEHKELKRSSTQVELKIHEDEKKSELENTWRSCCLTIDKRATMFFTTLFISIGVMIFVWLNCA